MNTVTLSSKYQVVIPRDVRNSMGLRAGTPLEVLVYGNRIELIPIQPMNQLNGLFKGIDTNIDRDEDRL